jgi:hypothetical protein
MRYGAWLTLTSVWPCVYATTGCLPTTVVHTSSLEEQVKMRDEIRRTRQLPIEGNYYEVVIDDTIAETVAAGGATGTYQSDIYFLPMTVNGQPSLFWEYFDMNAEAVAAASRMAPGGYFEVLDNGRFLILTTQPHAHLCAGRDHRAPAPDSDDAVSRGETSEPALHLQHPRARVGPGLDLLCQRWLGEQPAAVLLPERRIVGRTCARLARRGEDAETPLHVARSLGGSKGDRACCVPS